MAKIKLSPLVNKISGSAGPLLFSESRGISTVRAKKTPSNPNTSAQQAARSALRDLMSIYAQLHSGEKSVWDYYGAKSELSGVNAFLSQNLALEISGGLWPIMPPDTLPNISVVGDVNGACPGDGIINFTPPDIPAGIVFVYYHRMGNQGDPVPPVMTRGTVSGPQSSPVAVALINCADGDNWVYCYEALGAFVNWNSGFGAPVVL